MYAAHAVGGRFIHQATTPAVLLVLALLALAMVLIHRHFDA